MPNRSRDALTDVPWVDAERHRTELEVDDLGHGTRNSVSTLSIADKDRAKEIVNVIFRWDVTAISHSRSSTFNEQVDSIRVRGRQVHQGST